VGTISKHAVIAQVGALKIGYHRTRGLIAELLDAEEIFLVEKQRRHARPEVHLTRQRPPSLEEPADSSGRLFTAGCLQPDTDRGYLQPCEQPEITGVDARFA
jgi:hypothetical protein